MYFLRSHSPAPGPPRGPRPTVAQGENPPQRPICKGPRPEWPLPPSTPRLRQCTWTGAGPCGLGPSCGPGGHRP